MPSSTDWLKQRTIDDPVSNLTEPVAASGVMTAVKVTGAPGLCEALVDTGGFAVSDTDVLASDGLTEFEADDDALMPPALVAVTLKVGVTPVPRLGTVHLSAVGVGVIDKVQVCPVDAVTVYPSTGSPPWMVAAVHETIAPSFVATALTPVGALGALDITKFSVEEVDVAKFVSPL
jgi:hypothetical protein